jgi:hypothetical protein
MTSLSLRHAAQGHVQAGQAISVSTLAAQLLCPIAQPISTRKLIGELTQDSHVFPTWNFDGGNITGWTQLGLLGDGTGSFHGHFHDSGPTGYNYVVTTVLRDVKDQAGNTLVFAHSGSVHGTVDIGSRDDDWQDDSYSCVVAQNWDLVKSSRTWSGIHTSTDPLDVIEHIVAGMLIGLAIDAFVLFGAGVAAGAVVCAWQAATGKGAGIDLKCVYEF